MVPLHFLRAVILWSVLSSVQPFMPLPGQRSAGRGSTAFTRWAARGQPLVASATTPTRRASPAPRWLSMSSADQDVSTGGGTGTGVQTIVKERVKELTVPEEKEDLAQEQWWRVILHNDEIHTFDYVTQSITKVVKKLTMKKAYEVTMETHKAGKATVTQAWKSKAEGYCMQLQQCGLTASIAPDSKFEGSKDSDSGTE